MTLMQTVQKERIILRKLLRNYKKGKTTVSFKSLGIKDNFYPKELEKMNLVKIVGSGHEDAYGRFEQYDHLQLTEQGKHFFEKPFELLKILTLKNFWFPIAVAFITSLLTNGILVWLKLK